LWRSAIVRTNCAYEWDSCIAAHFLSMTNNETIYALQQTFKKICFVEVNRLVRMRLRGTGPTRYSGYCTDVVHLIGMSFMGYEFRVKALGVLRSRHHSGFQRDVSVEVPLCRCRGWGWEHCVFATASVSKFINGSARTNQLCMIACVALYDLHQSSNVLFVRLA